MKKVTIVVLIILVLLISCAPTIPSQTQEGKVRTEGNTRNLVKMYYPEEGIVCYYFENYFNTMSCLYIEPCGQ